jgi:hypothetical protein
MRISVLLTELTAPRNANKRGDVPPVVRRARTGCTACAMPCSCPGRTQASFGRGFSFMSAAPRSRCRCGRGEPQSRGRCGRGEPSPGAEVAGFSTFRGSVCVHVAGAVRCRLRRHVRACADGTLLLRCCAAQCGASDESVRHAAPCTAGRGSVEGTGRARATDASVARQTPRPAVHVNRLWYATCRGVCHAAHCITLPALPAYPTAHSTRCSEARARCAEAFVPELWSMHSVKLPSILAHLQRRSLHTTRRPRRRALPPDLPCAYPVRRPGQPMQPAAARL